MGTPNHMTYQKAYSLIEELQLPNIKIDQAYRLGKQGQKKNPPEPTPNNDQANKRDRQRNDNLQIRGNSVQQSSSANRGFPSRAKRHRKKITPFLIDLNVLLEDLEKDALKKELGRPLFIVNKDNVYNDIKIVYSIVNENLQPMINISIL